MDASHTVQTYFARGIGIVAQEDSQEASTSLSTSLSLVRMRRG